MEQFDIEQQYHSQESFLQIISFFWYYYDITQKLFFQLFWL